MKRVLIGLVAVAGLMASVLVLVASTSNPASGQQASITLQNTSLSNAGSRGLPAVASNISVTVSAVGGCNPGNRAPLSNGAYSLPLAAIDGTAGATEITGLISTNCNWEVSYSNPVCEVSVTVKDTSGTAIGAAVTSGRPLVLSGNGAGNQLQYTGTAVGSIEFAANLGGTGGLSLGSSSTTVGMRCISTFTSAMSFGTGNAVVAGHAGLEITATYTSATTGCGGGSLTNRVTFTGGLEFVSAAPSQGRTADGLINAVSLVSETVAQKATVAGPETSLTERCVYRVSFTDNLGNLRLARTATGQLDFLKTSTSADGVVTPGPGTPPVPADLIPQNVMVTYEAFTVPVTVVTTFPADEVFTTNDSADYIITTDAPCGGFASVIPRGFGVQGDAASTQVFPGSVTVYGSALNPILNSDKSFNVAAFAATDYRGTSACSVTVTERNAPERCSPVGGASQTQTYSAGAVSLAFEFTHTCEGAVSGDGSGSDGGSGDPDAPPVPPTIVVGGDEDETDSATSSGSGPTGEGFTG